jgi:NADH:ubiquinone oxidoreductase subunit 5 (subunit L)/multisubunit Na+/H+ antiporter MnhA subunit
MKKEINETIKRALKIIGSLLFVVIAFALENAINETQTFKNIAKMIQFILNNLTIITAIVVMIVISIMILYWKIKDKMNQLNETFQSLLKEYSYNMDWFQTITEFNDLRIRKQDFSHVLAKRFNNEQLKLLGFNEKQIKLIEKHRNNEYNRDKQQNPE